MMISLLRDFYLRNTSTKSEVYIINQAYSSKPDLLLRYYMHMFVLRPNNLMLTSTTIFKTSH